MTTYLDVAIIGAGPYGLSLAAHLSEAGVDHCVFGTPMDAWHRHMPPGMLLKSFGDSSSLSDPQSTFTLKHFSEENGLEYDHTTVPVKLENFVAYGKAFQQRLAPQLDQRRLVRLVTRGDAHELSFDNGTSVIAKHVVLAIGVVPFKHSPSVLSGLPSALTSHSGDYGPLDSLRGKHVAIIGTGSSALDIAALLSRQGSSVTVIGRSPSVHFQEPPYKGPPGQKSFSFLRRMLSPPATGLGQGWLLHLCADAPEIFHVLPDRLRFAILSNTLGPLSGYSIRAEVTEKVAFKLGRSVERVDESNGRVRLVTVSRDGTRETVESDHVVAATGYRVNLRRLDFFGPEILDKIQMVQDTPVLTSNFESSIPGLYFIGLASARSFGPVMRFVVGAKYPSKKLAGLLQRSSSRSQSSVSTALSE